MEKLIPLCVFALILGLGSAIGFWIFGRMSKMTSGLVDRWASENGLELLNIESRWFRQGPFFRSHAKTHRVYYPTLQEQGQTRTAYIRCRSFSLGSRSVPIDVRWE